MSKVTQFLLDCKTFYLATIEDDKPRVRPFGAVIDFDGKIYICTNNKKDVYAQIVKNPRVEISGMNSEGKWIRLSGKLTSDPRIEAKKAMLEAFPSLNHMYKIDDDIFELLYFEEGTATLYSFSDEPEIIEL